jgi:hypothetical protein
MNSAAERSLTVKQVDFCSPSMLWPIFIVIINILIIYLDFYASNAFDVWLWDSIAQSLR